VQAKKGTGGEPKMAPVKGTLTSHLRRTDGPHEPWTTQDGVVIDLPVVFDLVMTDPASGAEAWRVEATIGLCGGDPALTQMLVKAAPGAGGLDTEVLQGRFRWATPVEAVTRLVPLLIRAGKDPFAEEFPVDGYPEVTQRAKSTVLSDTFLEDVARDYLVLGRGYAKILADKHSVAPRTVISWVEKARDRGILTRTSSGRTGGQLVPPSKRRARRGRSGRDRT
jgi:hypothetical protein